MKNITLTLKINIFSNNTIKNEAYFDNINLKL